MDRRAFLAKFSAAALALQARVLPAAEGDKKLPVANLAEALAKAKKLGIGRAVLDGPATATVDSYGTWTVVYTAGKAGIKPGGGIRIGVRHCTPWWTKLQNAKPEEDGYISVSAPKGVATKVAVECQNWSKRFIRDYFPLQNIVEVGVGEQGLKEGQKLRVTYGDRSGGSKGMRVQPFDEERFIFMTYVDVEAGGEFLPLADSPTLRIVAAETARLTVIAPSTAACGLAMVCTVRAEDRFGNPAGSYQGIVRVSPRGGDVELGEAHKFQADDRAARHWHGTVGGREGVLRINATDGKLEARSNPMVVAKTPTDLRCLWGDLHGHTIFSDGRGTVEEYYDFARRVAALDFCAASDHAFEITEKMWRDAKAATNAANDPGKFTTFHAYEWSGSSNVGGDHNVYWRDDDPPIFRSPLMYSRRNYQMVHVGNKVDHVTTLFTHLRKHLTDKNVFCIPHRGGRPGNPKWHDEKVQRLVECYCEHFRSREWAEGFLRRDMRIGLMGSSDNHYGNPGYGYLKVARRSLVGEGLVAVWAAENTRRSIFDALYDRHCYATTGDRIVLDFKVNGKLMGSETRAESAPKLTLDIFGTDVIERVTICRNGEPIHKISPEKDVARVEWTDPAFTAEKSCWYHVHMLQKNGEEALSSPVWVN